MDTTIDKNELASNTATFYEQMKSIAKNEVNGRINTSLIGIVDSFDTATQTCSVEVIQPYKKVIDDGKNYIFRDTPYKLLTDVPVVFPSGGGYSLTFPVKRGDECLIIFSMRSMEYWAQDSEGGIQENGSGKTFSTNDAIVIVGINAPRTVQDALPEISSDYPELRSNDGNVKLRITDTGLEVDGDFTVDGELNVTGDIIAEGDIKTDLGDIVAGTISLKNHVHPAGITVATPDTFTGTTTAPTSPPTP